MLTLKNQKIHKFLKGGGTPRKATKEQIELNKRKQLALRMAGYNVKVDGSWGPWQEEQYRKISTHDKEYPTDILGGLTYLKDKITGNTTYWQEPSIVTGYTGEIRADNRSDAKRWLDTLLSDNRTPLGYLYRTVLPAGVGAVGLVYGAPAVGRIATTVARTAPTVARTAGLTVNLGVRRMSANLMTSGTPSAVVLTTSGTISVPVATSLPQWASPEALLGTATIGTGIALTRRTPMPISRTVDLASEAPTNSISPGANTEGTSSSTEAPQTPNQGNNDRKPKKKNGFKEGAELVGRNIGRTYGRVLRGGAYGTGYIGIPGAIGYGVYKWNQPDPTAADSLLEELSRLLIELNKLNTARLNLITIDSLRRSLSRPTIPALSSDTATIVSTPDISGDAKVKQNKGWDL